MYEEYLMHHGVKGMKWGVRHDRDRKGRKKRPISEMSDQELQEKVKRLNLENQYKGLTKKKKSKVRKVITAAAATFILPAVKVKGKQVGKKLVDKTADMTLAAIEKTALLGTGQQFLESMFG